MCEEARSKMMKHGNMTGQVSESLFAHNEAACFSDSANVSGSSVTC